MKKKIGLYKIINYIMIFFLTVVCGCALFRDQSAELERAKLRIEEARKNLEVVKNLKPEDDRYNEQTKKAQTALVTAEKHLKKGHSEDAGKSAQESLDISWLILKDYYQTTVVELAQKVKKELEEKTKGDADHPLQEYVPKLEETLAYAEKIETDISVSLDRVLKDIDTILQISDSVQTSITKTLQADVSFSKGKYDLSDEGIQIIETFSRNILSTIKPEKTTKLILRVVGYTDQLNFGDGTELVKELTSGIENVPVVPLEKRKFLNQRLSEFRARTIGNRIEQFISQKGNFSYKIETAGRGENIPEGVLPPYPIMDPRRRICKIYIHTTMINREE